MKKNPGKSFRELPDELSEQNAKLISASPYRATVLIQDEERLDEDFARDKTMLNSISPMNEYKKT